MMKLRSIVFGYLAEREMSRTDFIKKGRGKLGLNHLTRLQQYNLKALETEVLVDLCMCLDKHPTALLIEIGLWHGNT